MNQILVFFLNHYNMHIINVDISCCALIVSLNVHKNVNIVFSFVLPNIIQKHAILVKHSPNVLWVVKRKKTV